MSKNGLEWWKRTLDCTCIFLSAIFWLPLMAALACWIKCVSPGPVFFMQERVGFRGRKFRIFKFRSMHQGAPTEVHEAYCRDLMQSDRPMQKMDVLGDGRLIPLGAAIRAAGLDELPQIFNVLRGEMSLVGPRPCTPGEYEGYAAEQRQRFEAVPGLTGLWQVSGKNRTTFAEMVALDIEYARTKSLGRDLGIILRTPAAILDQLRERRRAKAGQVFHPVSKYLRTRTFR